MGQILRDEIKGKINLLVSFLVDFEPSPQYQLVLHISLGV